MQQWIYWTELYLMIRLCVLGLESCLDIFHCRLSSTRTLMQVLTTSDRNKASSIKAKDKAKPISLKAKTKVKISKP